MLKRLSKLLLFISILLVVGSFYINSQNRSFDAAGNLFSGSNEKKKKVEKRRIILSNDFWTNGRFNF